jgi:SAM-dependent methyltransferase
MNITKKEKLVKLVTSILDDTRHQPELNELASKLNINKDDIIETFLEYNLDVLSHGNEIYDKPAIRMVLHIHNLIEGSWHIERQDTVIDLIRIANPNNIVDLGFGVPSRYIKLALSEKKRQVTLCDIAEPAISFGRNILNIWDKEWEQIIDFKNIDISNTQDFVGAYDLYILKHSIEHVKNPTACMSEYVRKSPSNSRFLLDIPLGPITPEHYIAWNDTTDATNWLKECGLNVMNSKLIKVNPNIDLFAEQFNFNYTDYIVLCNKA